MKISLATLLLFVSGTIQAADILDVCINYHCEQQQQVMLDTSEHDQLSRLFASPATSAAAERQNIRQAIASMEQIIGNKTATHRDLPQNLGEDEIGQLDCIAESRNTQHYLQWLETNRYLKWHNVSHRIKRAPMFFDVHWGVKITDIGTGEEFVVDSWYGANGQKPSIDTLSDWLNKKATIN